MNFVSVSILGVALLGACATDDKIEDPALVATWVLDRCDASEPYRQAITFSGTTYIDLFERFQPNEGGCVTRTAASFVTKSYVLGEQRDVDGARNIDLTMKSAQVVASTPMMADRFNQQRMCGYTNWEVEVPQTSAGTSCDAAVGTVEYTIYRVGDELQLGDVLSDGAGSSPDSRPMALSEDSYTRS